MLRDAGEQLELEPVDEPDKDLAPPPSETGRVYEEGGEEEEPEIDLVVDASA